ncbi:MAG: hypothetical protein GSR86_02010 [Desulfurococcales archaeon]|nr:hypothetical protein [Desulfurococcales archaeon]
MTYWDILIGLTVLELALVVVLLMLVYRIAGRPIGARLVLLSIVFMVQNIAGVVIYSRWEELGYGPEVSKLLLVIQSMIVAGTVILIDITRK